MECEEGGWVKSWLTCWMSQSQLLSLTLVCFLGFSIHEWGCYRSLCWWGGGRVHPWMGCQLDWGAIRVIVGLVPCLGVPWCCAGSFPSQGTSHALSTLGLEPGASSQPKHQLTGLLLPPLPPTARNNNWVNLIVCPSLHLWYTSNLRQSSSFEQSDFIWYCFQKTKLDLTSQMTLYNSQAFIGIFRSANIWQQWKFSFQTAENNRHAEFSTIPSLERNNSLQGKPQEQKTEVFFKGVFNISAG